MSRLDLLREALTHIEAAIRCIEASGTQPRFAHAHKADLWDTHGGLRADIAELEEEERRRGTGR